MAAFQEVMKSEAAADAMKHDGVDPETQATIRRPLPLQARSDTRLSCRLECSPQAEAVLAWAAHALGQCSPDGLHATVCRHRLLSASNIRLAWRSTGRGVA
jgi:hypothetical protein